MKKQKSNLILLFYKNTKSHKKKNLIFCVTMLFYLDCKL